jgi:3-hydroxyisobutyrate dehydrogenase-like beta-hydroxyacid dehydrogenase
MAGAAKDSELILAAMHSARTDDTVMLALRRLFTTAADGGHGAEDMSAVVTAIRA